MTGRLRPYRLHAWLLVYLALLLVADARLKSFWPQSALGALTFLVLWFCTRGLPAPMRWQVWLCVVVATGFEILGSIVVGVYRYRLHNVPLYVPPGHGLVFLFGLTAGATPVFQRHGRKAALVLLGACSAWAVAGLTVLPVWTHRLDLQGAACLPIFAWFLLRSQRYALFAAIFVATTDIEIVGTLVGDWYWLPVAPLHHLSSGNPPSAIAGGYCVIDASVAAVTLALSRLPGLMRRLGSGPAEPGWRASSPAPAGRVRLRGQLPRTLRP